MNHLGSTALYCSAECANTGCVRNLTPDIERAARLFGIPLNVADLRPGCTVFKKIEEPTP